jgi:GNAT superfamily N-acetyltransferase
MTFRPALPADARALRDLERAANLVALAHVFPPDLHPFPDSGVLARWVGVLADPAVAVEVVDGDAGLRCFVAWDHTTVRHLAVHPDHWGTGLATAALLRAATSIRARDHEPLLWCLADNTRARAVYAHLGWEPTGRERRAEWPPHPVEQEHVLRGSGRA